MELTLPEKIQLLRKRMGLNQGQFGAKAFNTSIEAGRTKIKNIELGKQAPSAADLDRMANVLEVPTAVLVRMTPKEADMGADARDGAMVGPGVLKRFEKLGPYLDMLNRAVAMQDEELVSHIAGKLADVFARNGLRKAVND